MNPLPPEEPQTIDPTSTPKDEGSPDVFAKEDLDAAFDRVIPEDLKAGRISLYNEEFAGDAEGGAICLTGIISEGDAALSLKKSIGLRRARRAEGLPTGIATQIPALDLEFGGLAPGSISVITGPPGSGKTSLAKQILDGALSGESDLAGFYFAPGENLDELRMRTMVRLAHAKGITPMTTDSLRSGQGLDKADEEVSNLIVNAPWLEREYLIGPEAGPLDGASIAATVRSKVRASKCARPLVVIDHALALTGSWTDAGVAQNYQALATLAASTGGHVLMIVPFVRSADRHADGSEKREGPSEVLCRMGFIGLEAPLIISLMTGQSSEGCATIVKDRFGRTPRRVLLCYNARYSTFGGLRSTRAVDSASSGAAVKQPASHASEVEQKKPLATPQSPSTPSNESKIRRENENKVNTQHKAPVPPISTPGASEPRSPLRPKRWRGLSPQ